MYFSWPHVSALLALCSTPAIASNAINTFKRLKNSASAPIIERTTSFEPFTHPQLQKRASPFLTAKTKEFAVNGTAMPEVDFDIGESYAGLIPISASPDETRKLFFWFF